MERIENINKGLKNEKKNSKENDNEMKIILFRDKEDGLKTILFANIEEETLYSIFECKNKEGKTESESIELAVSLDNMLEIREFCNEVIEKIDRKKISKELEEI